MKRADVEKLEAEEDYDDEVRDGSVSLRGRPVSRRKTGGLKAAFFLHIIIAGEIIVLYGLASNMVPYLITTLQITSTERATNIVNIFMGITFLLSIAWGFIADTVLGRYYTILVCCFFTAVGMLLLTLSASLKGLHPHKCIDAPNCDSPTASQLNWFYAGLYMVSIAQAGIMPCTISMGRDQFDDGNPREEKHGKDFFKLFFVNFNVNGLVAVTLGFYIQSSLGYDWGWGALTVVFVLCSLGFLCGTPYFRHRKPQGSVLTSIFQVIVVALKNSGKTLPPPEDLYELDDSIYKSNRKFKLVRTARLRFLERAAIINKKANFSSWEVCTVTQVEELKSLIQILPIWLCSIPVFILFAQATTLTIATALTMDRRIGKLVIPAGSTMGFLIIGVLIIYPVFDWIIIPAAKKINTKHPNGLSDLQQIGIANSCAVLVMASAILVERKRVHTIAAHFRPSDYDELSRGDKTIPMSVFWLFPQYALLGFVDYLIGVAQLNFFHNETPESMRSIATSLYLVTISFGYFIFTALIKAVNAWTYKESSNGGWVSGLQIFQGGLEKFYSIFGVIVAVNFLIFLFASSMFQPKVVLREKDLLTKVPREEEIEGPPNDYAFGKHDSNQENRESWKVVSRKVT